MEFVSFISLVDTGLVSSNKHSFINKYCDVNGLVTVSNFLEFYYRSDKSSKNELEIDGLVDLLNYKYFNIVDEKYLEVLDKIFDYDLSRGYEKWRLKSDLNLLRRLGLNSLEVKSFYYFANSFKGIKIIDIIGEFLKDKNAHSYLGAYLDGLFIYKLELIYRYYNVREKQCSIFDVEREKKYSEFYDLLSKRDELIRMKLDVLREQKILNDKYIELENSEKKVDELIANKEKLLQKWQ